MTGITLAPSRHNSIFRSISRMFQEKRFPPELERRYDRETLIAISGLPPHLLRDIGVEESIHLE